MTTIKKITNSVPVISEMSSSFCCCLSAILFRQNNTRYHPTSKSTTTKMQQIYGEILTASGLSFSYIFKDNFLSPFLKTEFYTALGNDLYIDYAMNYGKCNYKIVSATENDTFIEICNSIDRDIPMIAEGLTDLAWCLITGYDDLGQLYGFSPGCTCCTDCVNCIQRKSNNLKSSEFIISDWDNKLKRIVIISDFNAEKYNNQKFIDYWLKVMEQIPQNGYSFGCNAIDSMINLLENDTIIKDIKDDDLKNLYRRLYTNSFIPEYRFFVAKSIYTILEVPSIKKVSPEEHHLFELANKCEKIRKNGFDSHSAGWKFWAALSEKGLWQVDSIQYASLLKNPKIRKSVVKELKKLKAIDEHTVTLLKDINY